MLVCRSFAGLFGLGRGPSPGPPGAAAEPICTARQATSSAVRFLYIFHTLSALNCSVNLDLKRFVLLPVHLPGREPGRTVCAAGQSGPACVHVGASFTLPACANTKRKSEKVILSEVAQAQDKGRSLHVSLMCLYSEAIS